MLFLSTTQGVFRVNPETGIVARLGPLDTSIEALAVSGDTVVGAITPNYGLPMRRPLAPASHRGAVRSTDAGRTWSSIPALDGHQVTALASSSLISHHPSLIYAGTDPAELLTSADGDQWTQGQSLREMPGYADWSYPLDPHTPHVMLIVPHPTVRTVVYAGIEVGGVVRSTDAGRTWHVIGDDRSAGRAAVHPDIHGLAICAVQPDVIYASTPQGVYYSADAGATWQQRIEGLEPLYCRPIVVHPQNPDIAVVVATHGASGFFGIPAERTGGAVFRTEDAGHTWRQVRDGLPDVLQPTPAMAADPHHPGRFYLPLFSGEVFASDDAGRTWQELTRGLPPILRAVAD